MSSLWNHDRKLMADHPLLAGVDEAGRGPLAGAVVAAVVCVGPEFFSLRGMKKACAFINDSKQLKEPQREEMFSQLTAWREEGRLDFAVGEGSVVDIAMHNILGATRLAMRRALEQLPCTLPSAEEMPLFEAPGGAVSHPLILVDGRPLKPFPYRHTALVKGDGKSFCIAAASIIAKVTRDRQMHALEAACPEYGFARHKGYGTPEHCAAIKRHGPTPHHREKFIRSLMV